MTPDYMSAVRNFSWEAVRAELGWGETPLVRLAHCIIDRHSNKDKTALIYIDEQGRENRYSYGDLAKQSNQAAHFFSSLGVRKGDRVAGFLLRGPEILITILATLKLGAIYVPIFTGFKHEAIFYRLRHCGARVICTHASIRNQLSEPLPSSTQLITVDAQAEHLAQGDLDFWNGLAAMSESFDAAAHDRGDVAALIYTSGSTGPAKGGALAINFLAASWPYLTNGADIRAQDIVWPTGDPGWGYGFVCYLGALAKGATLLSLRDNPRPENCLETIARHRVTNLTTTPTLLRSLMALGLETVRASPNDLRAISSCGEPLNGEVVGFFQEAWDKTPMDHFGATEYGLPIGNFNSPFLEAKPGSMGLPFPGYEMALLDDQGMLLSDPGSTGWLAKRRSADRLYWSHYWDNPEGTTEILRGDWIMTGDLAHQDDEGYYWFDGRAGDMIKSAGYRIGPFEVESALLAHDAVAEAAVIGIPDPMRGQLVKAYVVLMRGAQASEALAEEIRQHVKHNAGAHLYPRLVEFVDELPKTDTGKIQRFALRERG